MKPVLNREKSSVFAKGVDSHLTPKEFAILAFLMDHPGKIFTAEEIYENAWKETPFECKPIISVHIRHIREKIENNPSCPCYLDSFWGRGYRYNI